MIVPIQRAEENAWVTSVRQSRFGLTAGHWRPHEGMTLTRKLAPVSFHCSGDVMEVLSTPTDHR
jgi:hypothetical protein